MYANLQKSIGATENLMDIIGEKSEKDLSKGKEKSLIEGMIEFKNVSFAYPQRSDVTVLQDVSFSILKNQTVAVVGPSGAGKSTISSLLLNFITIQVVRF